jgi:hypothetical protein
MLVRGYARTGLLVITFSRPFSLSLPILSLSVICYKAYLPKGLNIYGQEIPFSKAAKYLGVTLDNKLRWRPHIENKIKKAKRTLMAIRSVIGKSWGPSPECAKWSWTGVIRPALTYGAIVWSRTASQSWAKIKLQRLQRMALSQIAHVRPSTPSAALEIMYGVPPLDLFFS